MKGHKYLLFLAFIIFIFAIIKYNTTSNPLSRLEFGALTIIIPMVVISYVVLSKPLSKYKKLTGRSYITDRLTSQAPAGLISAIKQAEREQSEIKDSHRNRANLNGTAAPSGILFGRTAGGRYVCDPAVRGASPHIFVYGPSGSGKTQCLLLPTICSWPEKHHILALDISGDIVKALKENPWMRKKRPIILDLNDFNAPIRFDPFQIVRSISENVPENMTDSQIMEQQARKIEEIAYCLLPLPPKSSNENQYFSSGGRDLLIASLTYGFYTGKNFADCLVWIMNSKLSDICKTIEYSDYTDLKPLIRQFSGQNAKNLAGVRAEASKAAQRIAKNSTLRTIFTPPNAKENATLISPEIIEQQDVFIRVKMEELEQNSAVIGLIFSQFFSYFYNRPLDICTENPILFLCDELASYVRYLPNFENHIRNLRKYGVRILVCIQDFSSLDTAVSKEVRSTIVANCGWKVFLTVSNSTDQKQIADLIGKEKVLQHSTSFSRIQTTTYTNRIEYDYIIRPEDLATLGLSTTIDPNDHGRLVLLGPSGYQILQRTPFWACKETLENTKNRIIFTNLVDKRH